ncbi:hypothetical protein H6G97_40290 [Nostoc flagelliforme FACHB-838]|uniref:Transposase n=1 Tax=Nostoc flagelliforme FACHB-838 TaxID=2692904 RepID=A0ABR8E1M0_9NOSO|nr:hypothetical protein [Nostoc flagelliforme]MBD2535308.1 hypothetical protein [Nostoc flagelliforme FACHB-838]
MKFCLRQSRLSRHRLRRKLRHNHGTTSIYGKFTADTRTDTRQTRPDTRHRHRHLQTPQTADREAMRHDDLNAVTCIHLYTIYRQSEYQLFFSLSTTVYKCLRVRDNVVTTVYGCLEYA